MLKLPKREADDEPSRNGACSFGASLGGLWTAEPAGVVERRRAFSKTRRGCIDRARLVRGHGVHQPEGPRTPDQNQRLEVPAAVPVVPIDFTAFGQDPGLVLPTVVETSTFQTEVVVSNLTASALSAR